MIGAVVAQVRGKDDFGIMVSPSIRREIVPPFKKHPPDRASKDGWGRSPSRPFTGKKAVAAI
jgi:hypothetical protein